MKRLSVMLFALAVVELASTDALAQRRGGGFGGGRMAGGLFLLDQKSVQDELKLSEDQVKQATSAIEKQRESMRGLRELGEDERRAKFEELAKVNEATLSGILKDDQAKRLKQISLQLSRRSGVQHPRGRHGPGTDRRTKEADCVDRRKQSVGNVRTRSGGQSRTSPREDRSPAQGQC